MTLFDRIAGGVLAAACCAVSSLVAQVALPEPSTRFQDSAFFAPLFTLGSPPPAVPSGVGLPLAGYRLNATLRAYASGAVDCPMRVFLPDSTKQDRMPIARPDTTMVERMPVATATCNNPLQPQKRPR
jgi:hypothetical protein